MTVLIPPLRFALVAFVPERSSVYNASKAPLIWRSFCFSKGRPRLHKRRISTLYIGSSRGYCSFFRFGAGVNRFRFGARLYASAFGLITSASVRGCMLWTGCEGRYTSASALALGLTASASARGVTFPDRLVLAFGIHYTGYEKSKKRRTG